MVKIWVPFHPHAGRMPRCVSSLGGCLVCCVVWAKVPQKKKSKSKLKDAMSQSSDEREEHDVGAGKLDSAVGLKRKRKSPQRKGMQLMGERAK